MAYVICRLHGIAFSNYCNHQQCMVTHLVTLQAIQFVSLLFSTKESELVEFAQLTIIEDFNPALSSV